MDKNQNNKKTSMAIWVGAAVFLLVWSGLFMQDVHKYTKEKIAAGYLRFAGDFRNGRAYASPGGGESSDIDKAGHALPPLSDDGFAEIQPNEGFAKKEESEFKKGFVNKATGEWVVIFHSVSEFHEGLAIALEHPDREGLKPAVIDRTGKWVIPPGIYSEIKALGNAYSLRSMNRQSNNGQDDYLFGYLILKDRTIIQPAFSAILDFNESGTAFAKKAAMWGLINSKGDWVVKPQFDYVEDFHEGLAFVRKGAWRGYIDTAGQVKIVLQSGPGHLEARNFSEGLAAVQNGTGKWGYIDKEGRVINALQSYSRALDFHEGLAAVSMGGEWGFINKTGQEVVPLQYTDVKNFHEGLAAVKTNQWGYIDKTGQIVIPFQYFEAKDFHEGLTGVRTLPEPGTGWIYINSAGALMIKNVN